MPPAPAVEFPTFCLIGFIFMYYLRKYHHSWWAKFNYVLSAALDSGTGISSLVIFLALQYNPPDNVANFTWWGSDNDACSFSTAALSTGLDLRCVYPDQLACPPA